MMPEDVANLARKDPTKSFFRRTPVGPVLAATQSDATRETRLHRGWRATLAAGIVFGFFVVGGFATRHDSATFSVAMLLAGGCLLSGGLVGFLFGIPRSLQGRPAKQADKSPPLTGGASGLDDDPGRPMYGANTNLEEVSDWLTKILVGVGLTQLGNLPGRAVAFGQFFAGQLGGGDLGARVAVAILLYFGASGFLFGYLWTRLFLGSALVEADALTRVERKLDAQQQQAQRDATALTLVTQHLQGTASESISSDRIREVIAQASAPVKVQLFYQAESVRRDNWSDPSKKPIMERTLLVFQAFADDDKEKRFHRAWAQLGYALKDQRTPDWQKAEQALTTAIQIRGPVAERGYSLYEYNRAVCRIMLDEDFKHGIATQLPRRTEILSDLRGAWERGRGELIDQTADIKKWLTLNKIKIGQL